jgi:hypothetical protein
MFDRALPESNGIGLVAKEISDLKKNRHAGGRSFEIDRWNQIIPTDRSPPQFPIERSPTFFLKVLIVASWLAGLLRWIVVRSDRSSQKKK